MPTAHRLPALLILLLVALLVACGGEEPAPTIEPSATLPAAVAPTNAPAGQTATTPPEAVTTPAEDSANPSNPDLAAQVGLLPNMITLDTQYHILRTFGREDGIFLYLILDKSKANLAMARFRLAKIEGALQL